MEPSYIPTAADALGVSVSRVPSVFVVLGAGPRLMAGPEYICVRGKKVTEGVKMMLQERGLWVQGMLEYSGCTPGGVYYSLTFTV